MPKKIIGILDTTLRDGEQSPGCSMYLTEKLELARQLDLLGVDVIEAGFAITSPGDLEAVQKIAKQTEHAVVASLARAKETDIDAAYEAVKGAVSPRIHIFLATSPIHMQYKLKLSEDQVLARINAMVRYAKKYVADVQFSAEDASRSDLEFLTKAVQTAIDAGATVINLPDTVGYATPRELQQMFQHVRTKVDAGSQVIFSAHCHNDLGLAVANSLACIEGGATQVECTVNGIGERAGNAALEEVVMALYTRANQYGCKTNINTQQIFRTSRLLQNITGVKVEPTKPIIGANAFAHESGVHQHGVMCNRATYEIIDPEVVGIPQTTMVMGKHSGRHAFESRLEFLGFHLTPEQLNKAFEKFKDLADKKKYILDSDLEVIVKGDKVMTGGRYKLDNFVINTGNTISSIARVTVIDFFENNAKKESVALGHGPIDAAYKAINSITGTEYELESYSLNSITEGEDALGEAITKLSYNGAKATGRGISTDVLEASIRSYINGINKLLGTK